MTGTRVAGRRLSTLFALVACALALLAAPALAQAASFAGEYPVGTLHVSPRLVGVDVISGIKLDTRSPSIRIDGTSIRTYITNVGSVKGYWTFSEALVDGVWKATWVWHPVSPIGSNQGHHLLLRSGARGR